MLRTDDHLVSYSTDTCDAPEDTRVTPVTVAEVPRRDNGPIYTDESVTAFEVPGVPVLAVAPSVGTRTYSNTTK